LDAQGKAMTMQDSPQPQSPQPQGALSAALSSLVAVGQYASRACAAARYDFATLFAHGASPAQRARAAGGLALTAIIVAVLGYAAFQEWQIHIVYQTQIQRNQAALTAEQARKAKVEADALTRPAPSGIFGGPVKTDIFGAPLDQSK
jgi:hypothetical protein